MSKRPSARNPGRDGGTTRVALLGSTGSIGRQSLDVLSAHPDRFQVVAMAAGSNRDLFERQVAAVRPSVVALADAGGRDRLDLPAGTSLERDGDPLVAFATRDDVDLVLVATGGVISLRPVLAALRAGKVVATANKETLVAGGHLVMPLARALAGGAARKDPGSPFASPLAWLRPIDSEHSAIWQCLAGERMADVSRLVLTASGGPFRSMPRERLASVTPADALAHPTWSMGAKITVDSATLMNKGLEVIEARWLYDVAYPRIEVMVHPQSIVHSLVEFVDGSFKAQLGLPDMRVPIAYALAYPERLVASAGGLDLTSAPALEFEPPDEARFPALAIARDAGARGPSSAAALISADEVAVARFLEGSLDFEGIAALCAAAVERFGGNDTAAEPDVEDLVRLDEAVRSFARSHTPSADRC